MEGKSSGAGDGNGTGPSPDTTWILMNLSSWIAELCKKAEIPITGNNIFSQSVAEKILSVLQQPKLPTYQHELEGLVKGLSDILGVSTAGKDICSKSFIDSLLEHVKQDRALVDDFCTKIAERKASEQSGMPKKGNCETEPPLASPSAPSASHSSDCSSSSESSETSDNVELDCELEDVKGFRVPVVSQVVSLATPSSSGTPKPEIVSEPSVPKEPSQPSSDSNGNNHGNVTTTPTVSPDLPVQGHQPDFEAVDKFMSDLPNTNEAQLGTRSGQRKKRMNKKSRTVRKNKGIPLAHRRRNKFHMPCGLYMCTCGKKYASQITQMYHIKFMNAHWKFKCERCRLKFYNLTGLKNHLKRRHGMENPLEEFVIGCTRCGIMFQTRKRFRRHNKKEHDNSDQDQVLRRSRRTGVETSRLPKLTPFESPVIMPVPEPETVEEVDIKVKRQNDDLDVKDQNCVDNEIIEVPQIQRSQEGLQPTEIIDLTDD